jgi:hypothetical protein
MHSFRAFAQGKATWILNYSWDGDKNVDKRESMMNLAMSEIMAGANFWDAPGHSMAGSNDPATRKKIFTWIHQHENTFFRPRTPIDPVGVYFSPETRNFYVDAFISSYRGILILLMQKHLEFQVVTPRTLAEFKGHTLVLPDVRLLSAEEKDRLSQYLSADNRLVITGADVPQLSGSNVIRFPQAPGKIYNQALEKDFDQTRPDQAGEFLKALPEPSIKIAAGPQVATSISSVDGAVHVFLANFTGLRGGVNPVQTPQEGIQITLAGVANASGHFLPFLGDEQELHGTEANGKITFVLPPVTKGAVFWYGKNDGGQ